MHSRHSSTPTRAYLHEPDNLFISPRVKTRMAQECIRMKDVLFALCFPLKERRLPPRTPHEATEPRFIRERSYGGEYTVGVLYKQSEHRYIVLSVWRTELTR